MLVEIALVATIVLVGVVAGNEIGTLVVIHPALDRVPYASGRPAAQAVVARFGRVMPVLMPITIAVTFVTALVLDGTPSVLLLLAGAALVAMLIVTFAGLMPLNTSQLGADETTPADEWYGWRARWLRLHAVRVVCDLAALVLVAVAAVVR
ncbi:MAG: anthrone oxygenase family protein [Egibacteraceae bacterium]